MAAGLRQTETRVPSQITLTKQIHVQDSYSRLGAAGGIKAVLPYYDMV